MGFLLKNILKMCLACILIKRTRQQPHDEHKKRCNLSFPCRLTLQSKIWLLPVFRSPSKTLETLSILHPTRVVTPSFDKVSKHPNTFINMRYFLGLKLAQVIEMSYICPCQEPFCILGVCTLSPEVTSCQHNHRNCSFLILATFCLHSVFLGIFVAVVAIL